MEVCVDLDVGYMLKWLTCLKTAFTHPRSKHLIVTLPGVEPTYLAMVIPTVVCL